MKRKYLILPLLVLLTSCQDPHTSVSDTSSTPNDVSTSDTSNIQADITAELEIIKNSSNPTSIRDNLTISKNNTRYLTVFERIEYDAVNGIYYTYYQESGYSSLDNPSSEYNTIIAVYYDGYNSFTLDSDGMYIEKEEEKEIKSLEIGFNFDLISSLTISKDGYKNVLEGIVSSNDANEFLSTSDKEISDISFKSYSNGEALQSIELTYSQNGFEVVREIEYSYVEITLEIPKNTK